LLALFFLRPNLFGELLAPLGLTLAAGAAAVELMSRRGQQIPMPPVRILLIVPVCVGLADAWKLVRFYVTMPEQLYAVLQDILITVGTLICVYIVCRTAQRRLALGRGFVIVVVLFSISYVLTALMWAAGGIGSGSYGAIPVGNVGPQPIFFPISVAESTQSVLGQTFPRFTGLGREPGWMAMYCAAAYFMCPMVGIRSRLLKVCLLVALAGTWSTAGFGVFVVVWTYDIFIRSRPDWVGGLNFLRRVTGLAFLGGAAWVAINAPILGLSAKQTQNGISLRERELATEAGLQALNESPFWGVSSSIRQLGINLISDIEASGLPFVILITLALLLPAVVQGRARQGHAAVLALFLTLLTSQPAGASTWVFALALIAYGCRDLTRANSAVRDPGV